MQNPKIPEAAHPAIDPGEPLRILIVDDNRDWVSALSGLISGWGFVVREAHSGAEALRVAADFRPRLVLLDLGLPDRHGYEVAKALRAQAQQRSIFFVAITGWTQIADQLQSGAAGISHHLMKPVNSALLREILTAYQASEKAHLALDPS